MMSSLDRDIAYPYASLVAMLVKMVMGIQSIAAGMTMAQYSDGSAKVYLCAGIFLYTMAFQARLGAD